jgi:putative transposase
MAHTYPNILIHCVFSTKLRRDSIPADLREKLSMYFVGIGKSHDISVLCAGGTANHAHLLIVLPATVPLAKAIQVLKANSSRWLGEHGFDFAWAGRLRGIQRERLKCGDGQAVHRTPARTSRETFVRG